ncbi:RimK/LysX family protein [Microbulbifer sp. 2205BS26-8]|uniref:ATP-dependent zinc protease family protein n=1 Tax=Microbulbifer sp. 2205BS26-8 TaxID=3064386 RepID=UPI00273D1823|nr:RimK/LysX family protein [Microbulbifer sp. 2205BS26-8]MDP5210088.1 RimK/LysX family protein [Microbulbifer sp. 2205BS26-8]
MQKSSLLWLMLAVSLLAGCKSLMYPEQERQSAPAAQSVLEIVPCSEPVPMICAEPETKVVEKIIERSVEKIVEVPVARDKLVLGTVEHVSVEPSGLVVESIVDSGSSTSTLRAKALTRFERDGRDWVRIQLMPPQGDGETEPSVVELPIKRYIRAMRIGFPSQRRPVVEMHLTVGDVTHMVEVSLTDEGGTDTLMLLGRNFLKDAAVVDVSRRYVQGQPRISGDK